MIEVLVGDNSFERSAALDALIADFDGMPERLDGAQLSRQNLPDILMGQTLFAESRLVIVRDLQANREVWDELSAWLERLSDQVSLVIIEEKIDKRSKTYRQLREKANIREFAAWSERDNNKAELWLVQYAKQQGVELSRKLAQQIVGRVGVNQWYLAAALEKLILNDEINSQAIEDVVEASPSANVFSLFETALRGDVAGLNQLVRDLELSTEPHQVLGLLVGQAIQLMAIATAEPSDNVAKDFAVHPYALSKLRPFASRLGAKGTARVLHEIARADDRLKMTATPPWLVIEKALISVAAQQK